MDTNVVAEQGDVLFVRLDVLPEGLQEKKFNPVLRDGELTGHKHAIDLTSIEADKIKFYDRDGILYVKALEDFKVKHEEHNVQTIEKGIYRIEIVKEFDHVSSLMREVKD